MRPACFVLLTLLAGALNATPAGAAGRGEKCHGFIGIECDAGLWCERLPGHCGTADEYGTCRAVPDVCAQIYRPVCGCNGKTYPNDCERGHARASKAHDGKC